MILCRGGRRAVLAFVAVVSIANVALAADDDGVHAFLSNLFEQAGRSAAPTPQPFGDAVPRRVASHRPLVIRRQAPKVVAAGPTKPGKVSIYEDATLRPGDAVMMADGIRIFAGSRSWPYARTDFVKLAEAHDLSRDTAKVLAGLNSLPRT